MFFDLSLKKAIIFLIVLGIVLNIVAYQEGIQRSIDNGSITIVSFYSIALIYLVYALLKETKKNKKTAYLSLIPLVLIDWINRVFNLYEVFPPIDILAHFLAGIGLTTVLIMGFKQTMQKTFMLNISAAFGWEGTEILFDKIFPEINNVFLQDPFIWDGVIDIIMHVIGMLTAITLIRKKTIS